MRMFVHKRTRYLLLLYTVFLVFVLLIGSPSLTRTLGLADDTVQDGEFSEAAFLQACRLQNYLQPPEDLIKLISRVYGPEEKDEHRIPEGARGLDIVVVDDLPFFPYWQSDQQLYAFHPMALGRFLGRLSCNETVEKYLAAAVRTAYQLPNGGLL